MLSDPAAFLLFKCWLKHAFCNRFVNCERIEEGGGGGERFVPVKHCARGRVIVFYLSKLNAMGPIVTWIFNETITVFYVYHSPSTKNTHIRIKWQDELT